MNIITLCFNSLCFAPPILPKWGGAEYKSPPFGGFRGQTKKAFFVAGILKYNTAGRQGVRWKN